MNKIGWTAEYIDPVTEIAFRKYEWNELRRRMIFTSFVGGFAYFLAIIGDLMVVTTQPMITQIVAVRILVLSIGLLVCVFGIVFGRAYTPLLNKMICGLLLLVLLGESAELVIKADLVEYVGIPWISFLVLLFYLSFPPRFISVAVVCFIGCSTFLITCILLGDAPQYFIYTSLLFFLVVNVFGSYVYLQFSSIRRREFMALEELKRNAEIDGLTQIYNRRMVLELGVGEVGHANNCGYEYSVMMIDVDNFKNVNDTYGHAVGDTVLHEIANRIRVVLRDKDIFGRFGGEEFVVFLPHTNLSTAYSIGERLRSEISTTPFKSKDLSLPLTISVGIAALTTAKETPAKLLEMADKALYSAKNTGKNKVCSIP